MSQPIYVTAQPDSQYLLWQIELQAYNLYKLGQLKYYYPVVGYCYGKPTDYCQYLIDKGINIQLFKDDRKDKHYIPSIRPHVLNKFFLKNPELGKLVFYHDSDIIYREIPNFDILTKEDDPNWYFSNTISYIGYDYMISKGEEIFLELCKICNISPDIVKQNQNNSGGAQYLMKNVTSNLFAKVELQCTKMLDCMARHEPKFIKEHPDIPPIQKWCADMWAVLWNSLKVAQVRVHPELDFSWAVDPIKRWEQTKFLHMAGATSDDSGRLFYKGKYTHSLPFNEDFSSVLAGSPLSCSSKYVELINEYSTIRDTIKYDT